MRDLVRGVGWLSRRLRPGEGTLSPFVPLSLRAFKGEGEIRIGAYACASAHAYAPNSVPGEEGEREDTTLYSSWGLGMTGESVG